MAERGLRQQNNGNGDTSSPRRHLHIRALAAASSPLPPRRVNGNVQVDGSVDGLVSAARSSAERWTGGSSKTVGVEREREREQR